MVLKSCFVNFIEDIIDVLSGVGVMFIDLSVV